MRTTLPILLITVLSLAGSPALPAAQDATDGGHWPSFRGPRASGVAEGFETPVRWDVGDGEGVLWRTPVPGLGHSSPVVWGDRVFVTTAVSEGDNSVKVGLYGDIAPVDDPSVHVWKVLCLDKRTGEVLWERTAHEGVPQVQRHPKSTHANPSVATDGEHVVAFFGSEGLYVYDMEGQLLWDKDLGTLDSGFFMVPDAEWGFAASPVIFEGTIIIQADVLGESFLTALDVGDGSEVWRTPREDVPTFSTPTVHELDDGSVVVVVNGFRQIAGYDARTGEPLWHMEGAGDIPTPTPVFAHGLVYLTSSHGPGSPIYAVRADARGEIDVEGAGPGAGLAWMHEREGAYMPTPVVYGEYLYVLRDNGVLGVYDARDGEEAYRVRLGPGGAFTASPVAADGKVYFTGEDGDVFVVAAGPEYELLATNDLGEVILASPAVSEGILLFRTQGHVIAVAGAG